MKRSQIIDLVFRLSALLILIAAFIYEDAPQVAKYAMIVGVAGFAATTMLTPYPGKSIQGKRLFNLKIFGILLMIAATYLMYADLREWVLLMLIAAILQVVASILLDKAYKKENKDSTNL